MRGTGAAVRSYLDGDDMARWLLIAMTSDSCIDDVIHVGSDAAITISNLAGLVAERASAMSGRELSVEIEGKSTVMDGRNRYDPQTTYTRTLLGLDEPRSLSESIDDMLRVDRSVASFQS